MVKGKKGVKVSEQEDMLVQCGSCSMWEGIDTVGIKPEEADKFDFCCRKCKCFADFEARLQKLEAKVKELEGRNEGEESSAILEVGVSEVDKSVEIVIGSESKEEGKVDDTKVMEKGIILGDSMVRELGNLVGRQHQKFARVCLPGAKVSDVVQQVERGVTRGEKTAVVWVGTNDVSSGVGTNVVRHRFRHLIATLKEKRTRVVILGLLPRYHNGRDNQRAKTFNKILNELCNESGVEFVDLWRPCKPYWLARDGVHLSRFGNRKVFELVSDRITSKN